MLAQSCIIRSCLTKLESKWKKSSNGKNKLLSESASEELKRIVEYPSLSPVRLKKDNFSNKAGINKYNKNLLSFA